jgi:hypothetical protein
VNVMHADVKVSPKTNVVLSFRVLVTP